MQDIDGSADDGSEVFVRSGLEFFQLGSALRREEKTQAGVPSGLEFFFMLAKAVFGWGDHPITPPK